ncbi:auxilin-related protein 2-like isoform X1 [Vicia villosa]|uniref:auxilin-related protein 2-like isoform X1 n=1 Tax=Vicia villosa TaxID=3911 RepID=UPI00273C6695|nr:auxilin-related protein 2-like isoform X1 [Vicia villosa]
MNDFDGLLGTDFKLKQQSAPMSSKGSLHFTKTSRSSRSPNQDSALFSDLFNVDSISRTSSSGFASHSVNSPVFDDNRLSHRDGRTAAFDDLLGRFGKTVKNENGADDFDDPISGFGNSKLSSRQRPTPDTGSSSESTFSASKTAFNTTEDPFKIFESASAPTGSSSGHFTDPLEEISKFTSSRSTKTDSSSKFNGGVYDDTNLFDGLRNSVPAFSSERTCRNGTSSPMPSSNTSSSWTRDKESFEKLHVRSPDRQTHNKIPVEHDQEIYQTPYDMPTYSSDLNKPVVGQRSTSPFYVNDVFRHVNSRVDMSPKYEEKYVSDDDIWLTVSEVPLSTQPTSAPPPSIPPPPRPVHIPKSETCSPAFANVRKNNGFSSFSNSTQFSQDPKYAPATAKLSSASQFDKLKDFAMGTSHDDDNERENGDPDEELEMNSTATSMKEAMERAESKFRHAKEVRGRENTKPARSKESIHSVKGDRVVPEERGGLDHEQKQKEMEEMEQRRIEREREEKKREQQRLEREREKARQAVERATREARERAAAEARRRAEKAAVEKANAEARVRAERAAVQRVQAEARERAAAEAKERAEKAAAGTKGREARERPAAARTEAETRVKVERAAVERAAAEARERAAAAARMYQQKKENDLESFFSMSGRANSAPRPPRSSSSDSNFDAQFQPDVSRKSTSTSSNIKKASSSNNIVNDLSSIFGASSSAGGFQEVEGESEERRKARFERLQRAQERATIALAEKNQRDLQTRREQAERHRFAETLDFEVKRWAAGKEGNLRALLSTLQYVLWPECGWQAVSLTDLITAATVKKAYRKATLCIHPDKVQQKGATLQQKYIAEKVFDLLKGKLHFAQLIPFGGTTALFQLPPSLPN